MSGHPVAWTSPTPLWGRFAPEGAMPTFAAADQSRPAILRFASDDFMERLLAMLEVEPRRLGDLVARPETWRTARGDTPDLRRRAEAPRFARALARLRGGTERPGTVAPTADTEVQTSARGEREVPLKLYQPAHERYYMVVANLVCPIAGFPDRTLATGGRDRIGFVIRRLLPPGNGGTDEPEEFAFIKDAAGTRWHRVPGAGGDDPAGVLVEGEELLPLFPLHFRDDADHPRRLLAGLVPVGRREEYITSRKTTAAPAAAGVGGATGGAGNGLVTAKTARKEQFRMEISEPWKNLVRTAERLLASMNETVGSSDNSPTFTQRHAAAAAANKQLVGQSWLLLLDFADYLAEHLPRVLDRIERGASAPALAGAEAALYNWIAGAGTGLRNGGQYPWVPFPSTLLDALARIRGERTVLESAVQSYPDPPDELNEALDWPSFYCLLAGIQERILSSTSRLYEAVGVHTTLGTVAVSGRPEDTDEDLVPRSPGINAELLDKLVQLVVAALDVQAPSEQAPPIPFAARLREALESTADDPGWFVMRCVYLRPDCGPLHPAVVSAPSQRFQLAGFFDPDAPARPIRIALPLDTTPAGLRKYDKNTAFILSDVLCGQVQRAKGLGFVDLVRAVLPWPLHKDLDVAGLGPCRRTEAFGMICSLSIPIITICALILLMIIVTLLDLIFRWLPWFIICFPVRGFAAKRA